MTVKTERCNSGHWDVLTTGNYPMRVRHIVGGNRVYLAESGHASLGYHNTIGAAKNAIEKYWREAIKR